MVVTQGARLLSRSVERCLDPSLSIKRTEDLFSLVVGIPKVTHL